jgi:hypothetical protein
VDRTPRALAVAVALLAACASARPARTPDAASLPPGWTRVALPVPEHGKLVVSLPPGWIARDGGSGEAGAPAIRIDGPGGAFRVLLTPLWNPGEPEGAEARGDTARLFADIARRGALDGSVEREIPLEELAGPGVKGFWFTATDRDLAGRSPGPEEWRSVLQGAAAVGPVLLAFTLLDDGPGPQRRQLLEAVRSARHAATGDAEAEAAPEFEEIPEGGTVPLRVAWPGKSWAVLVDLPGFTAGVRKGGAWRGPFVLGVHRESGVVASVSLLPAGEAGDAAACRDEAMAAIAAAVPQVSDVRTSNLGREGAPAVARAAYTLAATADGGAAQANVHAFLHRDGICANVHVSKASPEAGDGERMEAILSTVRFGEDL